MENLAPNRMTCQEYTFLTLSQKIAKMTIPTATFDAKHLCTENFVSATVYYPTTGESLPSIVLVGGWMCGEKVLSAWAPYFASHGIVVMTIGNPSPSEDEPSARCLSLLDASKALQTENEREGSVLFGRLDITNRAVMGYSLGGGGALRAANDDPTLKCAIALAPHSGNFDKSFPEKLTDSVPTLTLVGNKDTDAPAKKHGKKFYDITDAPKLFFEIKGGDHFIVNGPSGGKESDFLRGRELSFWANVTTTILCCGYYFFPSGFGTGPSGTARDGAKNMAIGEIALAWLQLFLLGDESARSKLLERPSIASNYESKGI